MKKILYLLAVGAMVCACTQQNGAETPLSEKEKALQRAMVPYIEHTVLPTYKALADASALLSEDCEAIFAAYEAGTLSEKQVAAAAAHWTEARRQWELSEAFLFGPAANHNIDPHIDSWPLDRDAMEAMLGNSAQMAQIEEQGADYVADKLGYGLLGFHAIEYMLYDPNNDDKANVRLHDITSYTRAELVYMKAVAADLKEQAELLYTCWGDNDNGGRSYGWMMTHAGEAGSIYATNQEAAEELLQGCIDIADEVGNTKIGKPANAANAEDRNYIESPYSLNSIEDFQDNIRSIKNAYCGAQSGDASVSDYVKAQDAELDAKVRAKIEEAIKTIAAIPEPFAAHATGSEAQKAVEVVGTELVDVLQEAYNTITE